LNSNNSVTNNNLAAPQIEESKEEDKDKFLAVLDCGHTFHSHCIVSWNRSHNNCPICRKSIQSDQNERYERPGEGNYDNNNNNNCQLQNTNLNVNNNINYNLIENIIFVQTIMHPSLSNYNVSYSNGFSWVTPSYAGGSTNYSPGLDLARGLFGAAAGGASSSW